MTRLVCKLKLGINNLTRDHSKVLVLLTLAVEEMTAWELLQLALYSPALVIEPQIVQNKVLCVEVVRYPCVHSLVRERMTGEEVS